MDMQKEVSDSRVFFHSPTPLARDTFFYPLCLGHYICGKDYEASRSSFDSYLLMYILRGEGYASTPEGSCSFREHQAVLIDCYKPHTYGASSDMEFYWIHFDGICARKYIRYLQNTCCFPLLLNNFGHQEITRLFSELLDGFAGEGEGISEIQLGKYITDLLTLLSQVSAVEGQRTTENADSADIAAACRKAAACMHKNFHQPLSVEQLAAFVSLSPYHFIRCFKQQYDMTPHRYLLHLRLECARFYLRTTEMTVKEIGFACGFQSENSFCIAFKKQAGVTPTAYRRH